MEYFRVTGLDLSSPHNQYIELCPTQEAAEISADLMRDDGMAVRIDKDDCRLGPVLESMLAEGNIVPL